LKDLVVRYLDRKLSRRRFFERVTAAGFSAAAAASILESLGPVASAAGADDASGRATVQGTGGELLVHQLRAAGVEFVFNCNGSGSAAVFDALAGREDMQVIQVLQEGQMVAVAHGYALASGKVAFTINDSVGLPNTLNNVYNAWKDRTPIVVAAQREASLRHGGRDEFEEWDDYLSPSAPFTRWRWSVEDARRIPEITRRAFKIASTPPQGPVTLAFPENTLWSKGVKAEILDRERFILEPKLPPDPGSIERAARLLVEAKNPLLLLGPEVTRGGGKPEALALAEQLSLPVAQAEGLFDDFPTDHPLFLGDFVWPMPADRRVDLVLLLGGKMPPEEEIADGARVVHVTTDPDLIGRVVPADVGIVAAARPAAAELAESVRSLLTADRIQRLGRERLEAVRALTDADRAERRAVTERHWDDEPLSWGRVAAELERRLDPDAIVVPELTSNNWINPTVENVAIRELTFGPGRKSKIGRTTGSALGWGIGASIGVKLAQPDRQVVALQGDGGFLFSQAETLWTMARYEVPVIVVIFNNRSYNGPRNRILRGQGRQAVSGMDMTCYLGDPDVDFARVASGFGVDGEVVRTPAEVGPAIDRAIRRTRDGRPYLIDAVVARTGAGAGSTWHPAYSVAARRTRKV
jgi:thiamine pyrophosphate-dependent acetolactate synthase large subunit-like protein